MPPVTATVTLFPVIETETSQIHDITPTTTPVSSADCRDLAAVSQVTPTTSEDALKNATTDGDFNYMKDIIATIPTTIADQLSPEEFTTAMFCGYLENYISPSIELARRLDDFRIDEVRLDSYPNPDIPNKFTATLVYSVKPPIGTSSNWIAGNGGYCDDGWICYKLHYVYVQRVNDNYIMAYPHTGP